MLGGTDDDGASEVVNIMTRTPHYEVLTMGGAGFTLTDDDGARELADEAEAVDGGLCRRGRTVIRYYYLLLI